LTSAGLAMGKINCVFVNKLKISERAKKGGQNILY
jgi:hypothetical protein